jgi:hypothetical protein
VAIGNRIGAAKSLKKRRAQESLRPVFVENPRRFD